MGRAKKVRIASTFGVFASREMAHIQRPAFVEYFYSAITNVSMQHEVENYQTISDLQKAATQILSSYVYIHTYVLKPLLKFLIPTAQKIAKYAQIAIKHQTHRKRYFPKQAPSQLPSHPLRCRYSTYPFPAPYRPNGEDSLASSCILASFFRAYFSLNAFHASSCSCSASDDNSVSDTTVEAGLEATLQPSEFTDNLEH